MDINTLSSWSMLVARIQQLQADPRTLPGSICFDPSLYRELQELMDYAHTIAQSEEDQHNADEK